MLLAVVAAVSDPWIRWDWVDRHWSLICSATRRLLRIEVPLALPRIIAGIRIATVTTIGVVTVTALIGEGGLGSLINGGLNRDFHTPLVVGLAGSVILAVTADLLLVLVERLFTPWAHRRGATGAVA